MLFSKKKELIGIDVGSTSIKLVQLKEVKGAFELDNLGIAPLPPEAIVDNTLMDSSAVADCIRTLVEGLAKRKVKEVASSVSGNSIIIRKVQMPASTIEELESEILWESEQYIPFDIQDVNVDFQILPQGDDDPSVMNVLLVASKKDIVNDYQSVFAEAGTKLVVVDVDAFAVQNSFEMNYDVDPEDVIALVNVGANMMNLIVVKDGVSLFNRDVQMGGSLYTEEIQKKLGTSTEESERLKVSVTKESPENLLEAIYKVNDTIALEIRRSLDFYNSNALEDKIKAIYLSGGGSKTLRFAETVGERLSLPVEIVDPFKKISWDEKKFEPDFVKSISPIMSVAVGLAARRLGDK